MLRPLMFIAPLLFVIGCVEKVDQPKSTTPVSTSTTTSGMAAPAMTAEGSSAGSASTAASEQLSGQVQIDGSSTVYPLSKAFVFEFSKLHSGVTPAVANNGTGPGIAALIEGRADIANASRPIKDGEIEKLKEKGIEYLEVAVAIDGLSVVVHPENTWCDCITIADLKKMWASDSTAKTWKDINADWPDEPLQLFGADSVSGTFDYFTEVVNGKAKDIRKDYTPSANDNVLVQGVSTNKHALGFFGYAYYVENAGKLKVLGISDGKKAVCVKPTPETIEKGEYTPLSRPLYMYVNKAALKRPEVAAFVKFCLFEGQALVAANQFVKLDAATLKTMQDRLSN